MDYLLWYPCMYQFSCFILHPIIGLINEFPDLCLLLFMLKALPCLALSHILGTLSLGFFVSKMLYSFSKSRSCWIDFLFACILGSGDRTIDGIASTKQLVFLICDGHQIILVILRLSVVMINNRLGQPGSVFLTKNKELICKSVEHISMRIVLVSKVCNLRNNN